MPCYDSRDHQNCDELQNRLNLATRVACDLVKAIHELLDRHSIRDQVPITFESYEWIKEHQRLDDEREAREKSQVQ